MLLAPHNPFVQDENAGVASIKRGAKTAGLRAKAGANSLEKGGGLKLAGGASGVKQLSPSTKGAKTKTTAKGGLGTRRALGDITNKQGAKSGLGGAGVQKTQKPATQLFEDQPDQDSDLAKPKPMAPRERGAGKAGKEQLKKPRKALGDLTNNAQPPPAEQGGKKTGKAKNQQKQEDPQAQQAEAQVQNAEQPLEGDFGPIEWFGARDPPEAFHYIPPEEVEMRELVKTVFTPEKSIPQWMWDGVLSDLEFSEAEELDEALVAQLDRDAQLVAKQ